MILCDISSKCLIVSNNDYLFCLISFKGTRENAALCIPSCNKSANCKMVDGYIYAFVQWNNFQ